MSVCLLAFKFFYCFYFLLLRRIIKGIKLGLVVITERRNWITYLNLDPQFNPFCGDAVYNFPHFYCHYRKFNFQFLNFSLVVFTCLIYHFILIHSMVWLT